MQTIQIKKVTINDIDQLQKISKQTFVETFTSGNTEENLKNYLEQSFSYEKLMSELNNNNSEFYFAELNNEVIGYLKLNFGESQTEIKDNKALEIERIYVLKEFHGKKVAQTLYDKAIEVDPRAIRFYSKNGFVEFDKHIFKLGEDEQMDIMMKLEL
ncbi:N-acetyltransferase [Chryseobacterium nematophagum]|uniref:N-acetyltransferase n=1 Tax=Chryseobacterium nematophagum TaxID=2305228 RepID=A0A3M7LCT3_9FLAO|nr:GNAT family N-acetyltransferase [Chryseobacterium nematophagum]RMZ59895.1 N-acetyltransferase [Chryseobacterium nematophagum]